jgi:hypothetical protein
MMVMARQRGAAAEREGDSQSGENF